ncbi:MAG: hypothetical protein OXE84_02290 [Rhodobacteraceae bacterium]|nr:hypothetical protein [Paracoccaceae bacterium]
MMGNVPDYLIQGEAARLFPVLATTSKEGRTTAAMLACLVQIEALGSKLLQSLGQRRGKRSQMSAFTEVIFKNQPDGSQDRPDGLIVLKTGSREWRALIETKVGNNALQAEQIERCRNLAKDNAVDCVITISNQFATTPQAHPLEDVRRSRSKIPCYHWSWMHVVTTVELLINNEGVDNPGQLWLLKELRRFLNHDSAGVQSFHRMPKEWSDLNRLVSSGGVISIRSPETQIVMDAWHQETRDLSLILSRLVDTTVREKLPRKHIQDPVRRKKDELTVLRDQHQLISILDIPNSAAPIEIVADMKRRSLDVGMRLRAPEDRKSTKARINWLLRQIKSDDLDGLYIRLLWPGGSEPSQHLVSDLKDDVEICQEGKDHLVVRGFHVFLSRRLGGRFTQQANFISDLEALVPHFYGEIGSNLTAWKRPAPRIKTEQSSVDDSSDSQGLAVSDDQEGIA